MDEESGSAHPSEVDLAESIAALREALAEVNRGEGIPWHEAVESLRRKHNLPPVPDDS